MAVEVLSNPSIRLTPMGDEGHFAVDSSLYGRPLPESRATSPELQEHLSYVALQGSLENDRPYAPVFDLSSRRHTGKIAASVTLPGLFIAPAAAANPIERDTSPRAVIASEQPQVTYTYIAKNASAERSASASKRIIFGEDVRIKKSKVDLTNCHWTKGAFTNSVRLANGNLKYYRDSKRGYLCRSKVSPTGWVKVKGGETGRRCFNPAKDKPIPENPHEEVLNVADLDTSFTLRAVAKAKAEAFCPGASATGDAEGVVEQRFRLRSFLKLKGAARAAIEIELKDEAIAKAKATAHCDSTETTTTTPLPTPTPTATPIATPTPTATPNKGSTDIDLIGPQHMLAGGIFDACAYVRDPEGDADREDVKFDEAGRGNFISEPYNGDEPNERCITYRAGTESEIATISATIRDAQGNTDTDTESFEVVIKPSKIAQLNH